jgi:hypothetical protein
MVVVNVHHPPSILIEISSTIAEKYGHSIITSPGRGITFSCTFLGVRQTRHLCPLASTGSTV